MCWLIKRKRKEENKVKIKEMLKLLGNVVIDGTAFIHESTKIIIVNEDNFAEETIMYNDLIKREDLLNLEIYSIDRICSSLGRKSLRLRVKNEI